MADEPAEFFVQAECLLAEGVQGILLGVPPEADAPAHVVDLGQVLHPQRVDGPEEHEALDHGPFLAHLGLVGVELVVHDLEETFRDRLGRAQVPDLILGDVLGSDAHALEGLDEALHAPRVDRRAEVSVDEHVDLLLEERPDRVGEILVAKDLVSFGVDRLALAIDHIVELDDALADVEVETLDPRLGTLDGLADDPGFDVRVVIEPEALHDRGDPLRREALHEVVVK